MKTDTIKSSIGKFIERLGYILNTADVAADCKLASEKLDRCAKDIVAFLNSNGYPDDAKGVEAVRTHIEATYGAPRIYRVKDDVECYQTKLSVLNDALDHTTHHLNEQGHEDMKGSLRGKSISLKMPDKMTLKWLIEYAPISFWLWSMGLAGAIFVGGIYSGQVSLVKELIGKEASEALATEQPNADNEKYIDYMQTGLVKSVEGSFIDVYYLKPFAGSPNLTLVKTAKGPDPKKAFEIIEQRPDGFRLRHFVHSNADTNGMGWKAIGKREVKK